MRLDPRRLPVLALIALAILTGWGLPARASSPATADLVKADLIAEPSAVTPGEAFWVGVRLRMKEHWHTYWRNPGDSGLPTEIRWSLPEGYSAGPIVWPTPERIPVGPLINFGYEGEVVLLTRITPPSDAEPGRLISLKADVSWLVCEHECVPGDARLALDMTVAPPGATTPPLAANRAAFATARAHLPVPLSAEASFTVTPEQVLLRIPDADTALIASTAFFFPDNETLLDHPADQKLGREGDVFTLSLQRGPTEGAILEELSGILVLDRTAGRAERAFTVVAKRIGPVPALAAASSATPPGPDANGRTSAGEPAAMPATSGGPAAAAPRSSLSLWAAVILAMAGGVVLNLMPCVFPVLSIKVLSLVGHSGESASRVRLHGLAYGTGVLASFALLAAVLLSLRTAGAEIGWGFQLQSPVVVATLAFLLFAMGLGLSGALHMGASLAGIGDRLTRGGGLSASFFTGVLATIVATPCTGPFMGAAIGFAITQSPATAVAVFLALGFGLALPFMVLTFSPPLLRLMPKPGPWMDRLKQALAFPLYATVAWLIWVLSQQVDPTGLFLALIGLVVVALAVWLAGFMQGDGRFAPRIAGAGVVVSLAALAGVLLALGSSGLGPATTHQFARNGQAEPFSQKRLDELVAEGRPVFVNMTAAWCITCLVNERTALSGSAFRNALADRGITYLKGDWTNQNPEITRLLERYGRGGVPLYLFYDGRSDPTVLPQVLTEATVLAEFARVSDGVRRTASSPSAPADKVR